MPDPNEDRAADRGETPDGGHGRTPTPNGGGAVNELEQGFTERDTGEEASLAAATAVHRDDLHRIERALSTLAKSGRPFTANSVDAAILADGEGDYKRLLLATLMSRWARDGRIAEVFDQPQARAIRRSRHGSVLRWWRGISAEEAA